MDDSLYTAKNLIKERSELLPTEITSLITGGALDVVSFQIQEEYHLTNKQIALLENEIILVLLLFLDLEHLSSRVEESLEINALTAVKITSDIHEYLFYDIEDVLMSFNKTPEQLNIEEKKADLTEIQKTLTPEQQNKPIEKISVTDQDQSTSVSLLESDLSEVQPMRTMETDMNRIHGYGAYRAQFPEEAQETEHIEEVIRSASQDDLLTEKPSLTDMPKYEDEEV